MASSDPFDEDDDLFSNVETLAALEQQALAASQAPKKRYHHTVAPPKNAPARPPPSSRSTTHAATSRLSTGLQQLPPQRSGTSASNQSNLAPAKKDPGPLNTEPRAGAGGFGWEHGGKRSMEGNVERHIAQIDKRQAYWSHGGRSNDPGINGGEEESYPQITMKNGSYGLEAPDIVDKHARPNISFPPAKMEQQKREDEEKKRQAAEARRAALMGLPTPVESAANGVYAPARRPGPVLTTNSAVAGPGPSTTRNLTKTNSTPNQQQAEKFSSNRTMSRSISAGQLHSRPIMTSVSRRPGPLLSPILSSQSSQSAQMPASQGSMARKAALELDEERRKREEVEEELQRIKAELLEKERKFEEERERRELDIDRQESAAVQAKQERKQEDGEDWKTKFQALQGDYYRAKGEAESMRRAQKDERNKHLNEADQLRLKIGDMELKLREREKEALRQVENVKTQAVFANHAAHNSAIKTRAASQRPMGSPSKYGSPRGKAGEESFIQRTSLKGKGREMLPPAPPPQPRFDGFNNAFSVTPSVSRVKRQRTTSAMPQTGSPSKAASPARSPVNSPAKRRASENDDDGPRTPTPGPMDDVDMDLGLGVPDVPALSSASLDAKAELLYHIFNYVPVSRFQSTYDESMHIQPVLYRILNYRPTYELDKKGEYGSMISSLLEACGNPASTFDQLLEVFACAMVNCANIAASGLKEPSHSNFHVAEVAVVTDAINFLAKTFWLFLPSPAFLSKTEADVPVVLHLLVNEIFAVERARDTLHERFEADILQLDRAKRSPSPTPLLPPQNRGRSQASQYSRATPRQGVQTSKELENTAPCLPENPTRRLWFDELASAITDLVEAYCWFSGSKRVWNGSELVDIVMGLTATHLGPEIVVMTAGIIWAASMSRAHFKDIMAGSSRYSEDDPVLDRISRYLITPPKGSEAQIHQLTMVLLRSLSMFSMAHRDAILLIGQKSLIVPALIHVLRRETTKVWGVWTEPYDLKASLEMITHAMTLFHHLVHPHFTLSVLFPPSVSEYYLYNPSDPPLTRYIAPVPSYSNPGPDYPVPDSDPAKMDDLAKDRIQGIDLLAYMREPAYTKEFPQLQHQFISVLAMLSYGLPAEEEAEREKGFDLTAIQDMAQEVLDVIVEGPEQDEVYELYGDEEMMEDIIPDEGEQDEDEAAALNEVIEIQSDSD